MHSGKPDWLKIKHSSNSNLEKTGEILKRLSLHTVCEQANCPNIGECFCNGTATFLILGQNCTRNCTFCTVSKGTPQPVDPSEPAHVAEAVRELCLKHTVITSVTRDDLKDGGASHFADVIKAIRAECPGVTIEVLIPDFQGDREALQKVAAAKPEVINHNIETVERLYSEVRPMAAYARSLALLQSVKSIDPLIKTKSGIMAGLGETADEVLKTIRDLRKAGCDFLTIGQYLAPSKLHHPVVEYIHPDIFEKYRVEALNEGFSHVASGPFVRSSYHAAETMK